MGDENKLQGSHWKRSKALSTAIWSLYMLLRVDIMVVISLASLNSSKKQPWWTSSATSSFCEFVTDDDNPVNVEAIWSEDIKHDCLHPNR